MKTVLAVAVCVLASARAATAETAPVPWESYGLYGALIDADQQEASGAFDQRARLALVERCLGDIAPSPAAALAWTICGPDASALDPVALDRELAAAATTDAERARIVAGARDTIARANAIGRAIAGAAKVDLGVAKVVELGVDARRAWTTYTAAHRDRITQLAALQAAAATGRTKELAGCTEATRPAFVALVRGTKFPWADDGTTARFYVRELSRTLDGYLTSLAYGTCALAQPHAQMLAFAVHTTRPGEARRGPRTLALAKAFELPAVDFEQHGLSIATMRDAFAGYTRGRNELSGPRGSGPIAAVETRGEEAVIHFASNSVEQCLVWIEKRGDKTCAKRGPVYNQADDRVIGSIDANGLAAGAEVIVEHGFPAVAWKGERFTAVLGVAVK